MNSNILLPEDIRSRHVDNGNGLQMHLLEAGTAGDPVVLLLHGFPELAFSWRHIMVPLANAGYHVVAPDQRGYGQTTGWDNRYDGDLLASNMFNLTRDIVGLIHALEIDTVHGLIGHDFGSAVAGYSGLIRPDLFGRIAMMSAPFTGAPGIGESSARVRTDDAIEELATLSRPRKHYQWYYSTREANHDMLHCPQGLADFLRAYFHVKSADWTNNKPYELEAWRADQLAMMPTYYIMDLDENMAQTVHHHMPTTRDATACQWLNESELGFYVSEYSRTGFQGGLNWYRCRFNDRAQSELKTFAGKTLDMPTLFIAGSADWGTYQVPGALNIMQTRTCTDSRGTVLIDGAGHWVQQEQPEAVVEALTGFLAA